MQSFSTLRRFTGLYIVFAVMAASLGWVQPAQAASLTALSDTMSSVKISTASSHAIRFTTPTGATDNTDTIIVTFPADFNFSSKTIGTVTFTHGVTTGAESTETLAASPSATAWGAAFSGTQNRILTLTAPSDGTGAAALSAGQKVIITYDATNSINASVATTYLLNIAGTFGDTGDITLNLITDDQVAITASVTQSLSFAISDNTTEFGTLDIAAPRFADDSGGNATEVESHTLIASTNAQSGYSVTVNGTTLTSGGNTINPIGASNTASATGTEQFGLRATATGGSGSVSAPYAASGFAFDTAAFPDQVASASTSSAATTYSIRYLANISVGTEPGNYATTLTYVATANF